MFLPSPYMSITHGGASNFICVSMVNHQVAGYVDWLIANMMLY